MNNDNKLNDENCLEIHNALLRKQIKNLGGEVGFFEKAPPETENQFLQSVLDYENMYKNVVQVSVHEKIGLPTQFKPVNEITDDCIQQEWISLYNYMHSHGVDLNVSSPNITARQLYRFATEELFKMETDDTSMPGLMTCFFYDEFHPDYKYDNQRSAVDDCIMYFFN